MWFVLGAVAFIYVSIRRYVGVHANGIKHLSVYLFYLKRFVILFIRSPRFDCYFFTGINIEQARQAVRAWATPSKNIECTYKHTNNKYMCHLILTSYLLLISEKLIDAKAIFVPVELHFIFVENHWQKKCCIVCSKRHTHTHSNPKKKHNLACIVLCGQHMRLCVQKEMLVNGLIEAVPCCTNIHIKCTIKYYIFANIIINKYCFYYVLMAEGTYNVFKSHLLVGARVFFSFRVRRVRVNVIAIFARLDDTSLDVCFHCLICLFGSCYTHFVFVLCIWKTVVLIRMKVCFCLFFCVVLCCHC